MIVEPLQRLSPGLGKLIVFEGIEGAGKTTQIQQTSDWLKSWLSEEILIAREPGGTPLGERLREVLLADAWIDDTPELLLYAADRAQHIQESIQPALKAGKIILCDRFTDSTVAYQGYGRGLSLELIEQLNSIATQGIESDITLWLDVDVETGLERMRQRGSADRMEQADLAFHYRVKQGFESLAQAHPERIIPIDANLPADQVQAQIRTALKSRL
ncbi:dTMP kinase [Roseofilum sp. BLCC_M91]|uniref:Thymidylate kinase n=1 Tax=Roseofilum halophilum BLCC-M91 TaxID=3022259 RepID=A0ABT7BGR1_9CYAN|nr:dTMP kinase [Roseofilum halophilum]MDJ1178360.1 dTMP kinase [Roseofilum halophilum BLCC-M91]